MVGHQRRTRVEALTGEWSVGRAHELHALAQAWAADADILELDCRAVGRVDLSFLQILLALRRELVGRGGALRVIDPAESLATALVVTGLDQELLG